MEPKPEGRRQLPPDRARTALGAATPTGRRVLINLSEEAEQLAVADLFQSYGWTVILCPQDMLRAVDEEEPLLCITDAKDEIVPLTLLKGNEVVILAVTPTRTPTSSPPLPTGRTG